MCHPGGGVIRFSQTHNGVGRQLMYVENGAELSDMCINRSITMRTGHCSLIVT